MKELLKASFQEELPWRSLVHMKMITVKVNNDVKVGDKAIVIGGNIKSVSSYTGVTPHVLMTSISKDIKRIYK